MAGKPSKSNRSIYMVSSFIIILLLALIFVSVNWEALTRFATQPVCAQICHFIEPEFASWKNSTHSQLTCYDCHIEDFYLGFSKKKLSTGTSRVWLTLRDSFKRPINADSDYSRHKIPTERCLKCHSVFTRNVSPRAGMKMSKDSILKHLEAGLTCTICHNRVAHRGAEEIEPIKSWEPKFKYENFMKMKEGCWRCHSDSKEYLDKATLDLIDNGKKPPTECNTCHYEDFLSENIDLCKENCHDSDFLTGLLKQTGGYKVGH